MNSNRELNQTLNQDQALGEFLLATMRYVPLLTSLLTLGLLGVYALGRSGVLDAPTWQLLAVAGVTLAVGLLHFVIGGLVRRGQTMAAYIFYAVILDVWAISIALLWAVSWPIAIPMVWAAPAAGYAGKAARRWVLTATAASAVLTAVIVLLDTYPPLSRMASGTQTALASLVLVGSTVLLFLIGSFVLRLIQYRSLQSRLVTSFVLIMALPVLITTAISAVAAFNNSQEQFSNSLQAVTSLKHDQINATVSSVAVQLAPLELSTGRGSVIYKLLTPAGMSQDAVRLNESTAATLLRDVMVQNPASQYDEILIADRSGNVVFSTYELDKGLSFSSESFFQQGLTQFHAEMQKIATKQNSGRQYKLVATAPVYGSSTQDVRGVIVAVMRGGVILGALGPVPGIPDARTYIVSTSNLLVSDNVTNPAPITAWPIVHTILGRLAGSSNMYDNYDGLQVMGFTVWDSSINGALVAELPRSDVYNRALGSLLVSGLVGLFAIIVAAITAFSTSSSISEPIAKLAGTARALSAGDLTARSAIRQRDEVGNLADSFNAMAERLQGIIGNLEQRVNERTEALEQQSLRLRTAAEVARDAASAPNLDALLDQAARLIQDRFGFYHAGIFLLDDKREYAVLRASPSTAGQVMLERRHSLKVGEQGIVGRVAATGEPRIALDTGVDPVYFSNPLLPNTHSEMALPLKTSEGTIGVIDIQSDQPEAFTQDDIAIVQVMADQLATAIQRTNLLQQVQEQLKQLETTYQSFTEQTWRSFGKTGRPHIGYRFDNIRLDSIRATPDNMRLAAQKAQLPAAARSDERTLEVPIRLRGQVIGVVTLRFQSGRIPEATSDMVQQIADRLATALENARLLEDSLRRANKERAIGEITSKISQSVNMRNVLQTAVEELGRAIPGSEVMIQFRPDTEI